jgi:hypothetical protein
MGISMVLLPMFWLSHNFSWRPVKLALMLLSIGVISVVIGSTTQTQTPRYIGYALSVAAIVSYIFQIFIIYKTRVRIEKDIYLYSLVFSYGSFFVALFLGVGGFIFGFERFMVAGAFLSLVGFVSFLITGHLYKIVPFLVWYQRFSPLIGKKKVPMLADMVPKRSAFFGFLNSAAGVSVATVAILVASDTLFYAGVSFLLTGTLFVLKDMVYMINFKG